MENPSLFTWDPVVLGSIVLRSLTVYVALLIGLRLAGKRELGQMSVFDLVVILIISNAVQNAMVGPDTSLTGGLVAAASLLLANWLVDRLRLRFGWFQREVRGTPTLLIDHGAFIPEHLRREGLSPDDVLMALREHGIDEPSECRMAVLEVDGTISIVPQEVAVQRTRRRLRGRKPVGG
jgi:uncharacterized membrane protein YcaP (DUF421 family)